MSWKEDKNMSGSNTIPLGKSVPMGGSSRFGGMAAAGSVGAPSLLNPTYLNHGAVVPLGADTSDRKRPAERESRFDQKESREERKKKRKSRWTDETAKTFIPGLPTMIPNGLSKEQEEAYLLQLKIEEASRRLRSGDLGIPINPEDRSPSPEPIYSSDGKRLNTREYRKRKELEESRHESIQRMMVINTEYKPPPDYKAPQIKVSDKVMIPQDNHPDINFVGLLIGPRGNTLKNMEKDTGAKIIIRGKGSVKEGKVGRKDGQPLPGEDEPLHAYVTATDPEAVKRAVNKIKEIIQQGVEVPEGSNELRKMQLRELALLNGTLREDGQVRCTNCGAADHKTWQCQDKANVTNNVVCTSCGAVGHIAGDCKQRRPGANFNEFGQPPAPGGNKIDQEYLSFMAELGDGPPGNGPSPPAPPPGPPGTGARPPPPGSFGGGGQNQPPPRGALPPPPGGNWGPPGGPPGGNNWSNGGPPPGPPGPGAKPLMSQPVQPPWGGNQKNGNSGGGNNDWNYPPPPPGNMPPWPGGQGGPPGYPGPPPPPSSKGSSNGGSNSWGMPPWAGVPPPPPGGQGGPPGGPGPVPPPPMGYWNQGWGQSQSGGQNSSQLSNILGAPPPPPPPS